MPKHCRFWLPIIILQVPIVLSENQQKQYQGFIIPKTITTIPPDYQTQWKPLTGFELSGLHWDQFVMLYTNKGVAQYESNYFEYLKWYEDPDDEANEPAFVVYPEGTVMLKENYKINSGRPEKAISITAMIKREADYAPSSGNWQFLQFNADGKIILNGNTNDPSVYTACGKCHQNVSDRDYIFSQIFSTTRLQ